MSSQPYRTLAPRNGTHYDSAPHRLAEGFQVSEPGLSCDLRPTVDSSPDRTVTPGHRWYLPIKAGVDVALGLVLLILTAPVTLLAAVLVKLTSKGPAFYSQTRLGKDGRTFRIYKLRTMVDKAEILTGPVWSTSNDVRVTPLGWILRKTHIDEFPQLVNVLRGEMSLIGPRPERPEIAAKLEWDVPCYRERLNVRPGITGFAQVRLPPDTDLESVRRKVVYDVYYVQNVSPWLDFQLLVVTGWSLLVELTRYACDRFALPSPDAVERGFLQAVGPAGTDEALPLGMSE